ATAASVPTGLSHTYPAAGDFTAIFSARDEEGNVTVAKRLVRVGSAAPLVVIDSPKQGDVVSATPVLVSYRVNNTPFTKSVALPHEGLDTIRIDTTVNGETGSASITVTLNTQDTKVVITSPATGTLTNKTSIAVAWTVDGVAQTAKLSDSLAIEGENTITREFTSPSGVKSSASVKVIRDTKPPLVVITSPAEGTTTGANTVAVAWTVDGVAQTTRLTDSLKAEGENTIAREATDSAGNKGSASVKVIRNGNAPAVAITSPAAGAYTNKNTIAVAWTVDGVAQTDQLTDSLKVEGENTILREFTNAAKVKGSASIKVIRDTKAPVVVITSPAAGTTTAANSIAVAWSVDGVAQTTKLSDSLKVDGENIITRTSTDSAGNVGTASVTIKRDSKAPAVAITAPAAGLVTNKTTVTVAWTVNGVAQATQLTDTLKAEGENTITREFTSAGGVKGSASVKVTLDTKKPVIVITSPAAGSITSKNSVTVAWTVDGVAQTTQLTDSLLVDGDHVITRSNTDAAGNVGTASVTIKRDSKAPVVAITAPVAGTVTNKTAVTVAWSIDGVAQTTQLTDTLKVEGENTITREFTSTGGVKGSASVKVILDTKKPVVLITAPVAGLVVKDTSVTVAWSVDGVAQTTKLTQSLTVEGANAIVREATDAAGNTGTATVSVIRDTQGPTAPVVSGTTPTNDATPTWSWVSGGGGNGTFRYKLDNADLTTGAITVTTLSFTPTAIQTDGQHTLYVQERDAAGNWSASKSLVIQIDATAPTVAITSPTAAATYLTNQMSLIVSGTAADVVGLASVTYALSGATITTDKAATGTGTWTFTASGLNDGDTKITVTARDAQGNSKAAVLTVTRRANVVFVKASATGGDGSNWDNAYKDLQQALGSTQTSGEIWVAQGTYKPTANGGDATISFEMKNLVSVYGGFAGTETARAASRNAMATPSILSGAIGTTGTGLGNSRAVIKAENKTLTLDGFIIEKGNSDGGGGGINITNSVMTISNCLFRNNTALGGGAVTSTDANVDFKNCVFLNNGAAGAADAALWGVGNVKFTNCSFWNNDQTTNSIGSSGSDLTLTIRNCIFWAATQSNVCLSVGTGTFNLSHTILQGGNEEGLSSSATAGTVDGTTIYDLDPLYTSATNLHLKTGSPAINKGLGSAATATDLEGRARSTADIGAYEF
ncbi:MAG: Ig-like domain-containing protein, partial [Fibrobacteria bacterium]